MECGPRRCLWIVFGLLLFFTYTLASETNGEDEEVRSSLKSAIFSSSHNYYAEGGNLQSNLSSVFKRKVTAGKETPLNSTENVTTDSSQLKSQAPVVNSDMNSGKGTSGTRPQVIPGITEDQSTHSKMPQFLNASSTVKAGSPNTNVSDQQSPPVSPVSVLPAKETLKISANSSSPTPSPKKKNKPDVTYDENDLPRDENGTLILPTGGLVGSGPSFDYIVPIVIALLTVPFLAVIGAFFYKRARDFWDRRHYRRMDFLIDGMYND